MKLLISFCACLISFYGFTQVSTDNSEINSELCTTNYFTQKDDIQSKFDKIYPKSELLAANSEICLPESIEIKVFDKFNPEIFATIYILKNSDKLKRK